MSSQETVHNRQHCADSERMNAGKDMTLSSMAETPLFSGLPESVRASLALELGVQVKVYKANELVVHECEPASWIVCILSGRVHLYECGFRDDSRHLVRILSCGDVYGASFPMVNPETNPAMLIAVENARLLVCRVDRVRQLVQNGRCPLLLANLYAVVARQGFYAWRKVSLLSCYEIGDRVMLYLRLCREENKSYVAVRSSELAALIGVNRTALYRAIARLQTAGLISVVGGKVSLAASGKP